MTPYYRRYPPDLTRSYHFRFWRALWRWLKK
jgi:hypothetical protein